MIKKYLKSLILSSVVIIVPLFIGLALWNRLPDTLAIHFNAAGEPDGWSSKAFAVLGMPCILLAAHWLCMFVTLADPKRQNISGKIFSLVIWIMPAVSLLCGALTMGTALGKGLDVNMIAAVFVGFLFIIIGNYLPKCRQNYTVGIKVPWALHDEENWNRTHRFAGRLWVIGGFIFLILGLFGKLLAGLIVILPMAVAPVIYSYVYYLKHRES